MTDYKDKQAFVGFSVERDHLLEGFVLSQAFPFSLWHFAQGPPDATNRAMPGGAFESSDSGRLGWDDPCHYRDTHQLRMQS